MRHRRNQNPVRPRGLFSKIAYLFRERQVYVRSRGEVQFITLSPLVQVLSIFILLSGFFWIAFAAINITFKDELIAVKERRLYTARLAHENRLAELRRNIDRLNRKLLLNQKAYLAKVDDVRAEYLDLVERHKLLTSFFRQGWMPVKRSKDSTRLKPLTDRPGGQKRKQDISPEKRGKSGLNEFNFQMKYAKPFRTKRQALAPLADLRREMAGFEDMQVSLMSEVVAFSGKELARRRNIVRKLGINPVVLAKNSPLPAAESTGGPFVAANAASIGSSRIARLMRKAVANFTETEKLMAQTRLMPLTLPLGRITRISSRFGLRRDPLRRVAAMHTGIDLKGPYRAKVHAPAGGIVEFAGRAGGYGKLVRVRHANGISTRYAHLAKILVKKGEKIEPGQVVGLLGNTGRSTGPHLHYEIRRNGKAINPVRFWNAHHALQALTR